MANLGLGNGRINRAGQQIAVVVTCREPLRTLAHQALERGFARLEGAKRGLLGSLSLGQPRLSLGNVDTSALAHIQTILR